ncbi:MAG: Rpp14/Pop5 family protein [Candidatus Thermoplasmatota archaeon]|nr:Rpp14/Pop5 family protein [Candidatus Thermoplasmatota archaeon]
MVKEKTGRQRYILFSVNGGISRSEIIHAINNSYRKAYEDDDVPWLTVYEKKYGIARCKHTRKDDVINLLNSLKINDKFFIRTLKTSGTIKKLKKEISNF